MARLLMNLAEMFPGTSPIDESPMSVAGLMGEAGPTRDTGRNLAALLDRVQELTDLLDVQGPIQSPEVDQAMRVVDEIHAFLIRWQHGEVG